MRAGGKPKYEFPPKVKKNTFSFPLQITYEDDSYLTKIGIPCVASKFHQSGDSAKKNSKSKKRKHDPYNTLICIETTSTTKRRQKFRKGRNGLVSTARYKNYSPIEEMRVSY
jgi:hypothetical protein